MAANSMTMTSQTLIGRSAGKPFTGQPIKASRAIAPRARSHVVKAAAEEQKAPNKLAVSLVGALAAAQLALLPAGPAEAFNLFPRTAVSQSARDSLNKKTENLPSIAQTGKDLTGGSDPIGAKDPKDLGKAVGKATPDVDLTKNPKSLGKDAIKGAKNALPDVSAVPTREEIIKKARGNRSSGGSVASKAKKGATGNPLSGVGTGIPQVGNPAKKASKAASSIGNKANKTANKAASKVPSAKDIQKKLDKPLAALPDPKELANKAKVSTPNAENLASKAKAAVPKPAGDLKSKIKNTPSATMGLSFELASLQGQDNQSQNYPSPGKGYQAGKPSETIGPIPDKITSPTDMSMKPNPKTAGSASPGAGYGVPSTIGEVEGPDVGKAAEKLTPDVPNPAEKAKDLGNPLDSIKGLFNQ